MHVVVPIKQVPETGNVRMDPETGTMIRDGVETVVNPLDLYAIEAALTIAEAHGGRVTAITMGPAPAEKALKEALAMGCSDAVLLCDRRFGGADTWATSYTLSRAIARLESVDLVIAGERATDGDTAQVGPGIAAWLDLPLATYTAHIESLEERSIVVDRLVEEGYQRLRLPLPALLTVVKEIASPRLPTLRGKKRAKATDIPLWDSEALDVDPSFLGLKGSPTKVVRIATPKVTRSGTIVTARDEAGVTAAVSRLVDFLETNNVLSGGAE